MKLTKRQRDEAVTVLRCAADVTIVNNGTMNPIDVASGEPIAMEESAAYQAWLYVSSRRINTAGNVYWWSYIALEAAALLEDGWTPEDVR